MNGDGFIDSRDETFIGYSDVPENTYALSLGCEYKGIGFSIMFQGVDHVSRYYDAGSKYAFVNGGKVKEHHLNRWNPTSRKHTILPMPVIRWSLMTATATITSVKTRSS